MHSTMAYLDAGTGSMIIAAFAGGVAGIGVLLRFQGNRILGTISKKHRRKAEAAQAQLLGVSTDDET